MTPYLAAANLEERILLATPLELIQILLDQGHSLVVRARRALAEDDPRTRAAVVSKAHAVLAELIVSLDPNGGEETARRKRVYGSMLRQLSEAHATASDRSFAQLEEAFGALAANWREICGLLEAAPARPLSAPVEAEAADAPRPIADPYAEAAPEPGARRGWSL